MRDWNVNKSSENPLAHPLSSYKIFMQTSHIPNTIYEGIYGCTKFEHLFYHLKMTKSSFLNKTCTKLQLIFCLFWRFSLYNWLGCQNSNFAHKKYNLYKNIQSSQPIFYLWNNTTFKEGIGNRRHLVSWRFFQRT